MTVVVSQLWLMLNITELQLSQQLFYILHLIIWEFCDYLLLILAEMSIKYLMILSEERGVCVFFWGGGLCAC